MLQAVYERGIRPDLLVGTSAGARPEDAWRLLGLGQTPAATRRSHLEIDRLEDAPINLHLVAVDELSTS